MFKALLIVLISTSAAHAHLMVGTYEGKSVDGSTCKVEVKDISYKNNQKHPLNEEVTVQWGDQVLVLTHPPIVQFDPLRVGFDHDQLSQVIATQGGAIAYALKMDHSPGKDGPEGFYIIDSLFSNPAAASITTCKELVAPNK